MVEVPSGGGAAEPRIKLYADANGHVGQIEVFNRQGGRLGTLTQSASAFTLTREPGGGLRAVPFQIPPGEAARDRGVLQRLRATHTIGQRMTRERMRTRGLNRPGPNQRTPGREHQQPHREQRQGGPHATPRRSSTNSAKVVRTNSPAVTQHQGGPSPQDRTLHPVERRIKAARQTPAVNASASKCAAAPSFAPRTGAAPRGGSGGGGGRNKRR